MPTFLTTNALVLSRHPWSETSQIVTLLTPSLGKVGVVARGARKMTSEFGPALEPITEAQVVLSLSSRSDLANVRSADVEEHFPNIRRSLVKISLASALCELAERAVAEGEPNEPLYGHLRQGFAGMDQAQERLAVNWLWRAAIDVAADLGYGMQFDRCVRCRARNRPHPGFSSAEGGPVCPDCRAEGDQTWLAETQETLGRLAAELPDGVAGRRIRKRVNWDIRKLFEQYFRYHIPNFDRFRSLEMLADTQRAPA